MSEQEHHTQIHYESAENGQPEPEAREEHQDPGSFDFFDDEKVKHPRPASEVDAQYEDEQPDKPQSRLGAKITGFLGRLRPSGEADESGEPRQREKRRPLRSTAEWLGLVENQPEGAAEPGAAEDNEAAGNPADVQVKRNLREAFGDNWRSLNERLTNPDTGRRYTIVGGMGRAATWAYVRAHTAVLDAGERINDRLPGRVQERLEGPRTRQVIRAVGAVGLGLGLHFLLGEDSPLNGMHEGANNLFDPSVGTPDHGQETPSRPSIPSTEVPLDTPSYSDGPIPPENAQPTPEAEPSGSAPEAPESSPPEPEDTEEEPSTPSETTANDLLEQHAGESADAARTIEVGEGAYSTFEELGIPQEKWEALATDPDLIQALGEDAYSDKGVLGWQTNELSGNSIEQIYQAAEEIELPEVAEPAETPEAEPEAEPAPTDTPETEGETGGNTEPEPAPADSEIAEAIENMNALPVEEIEAFDIPNGGGGEELMQSISNELWPGSDVTITPETWYRMENDLLNNYPTEFYRMNDGHVGLSYPGFLSEEAKQGILEGIQRQGIFV